MAMAVLFGVYLFLSVFYGKTMLLILAEQPVIGVIANWYMGWVGELGDSLAANIVYAVMAAHLVIMPLSLLIYGPSIARKAVRAFVVTGRYLNRKYPRKNS